MSIQDIVDGSIATVETDMLSGGFFTLGLIFNIILPILFVIFIVYISFKGLKLLARTNKTLDDINMNLQNRKTSSE